MLQSTFRVRDVAAEVRSVLRARATRGAATLFAGTLVAGALNYVYNVVMARERFLGPVGFGTLSALSSLLSLEGIFTSALTTAVAGVAAHRAAHGDGGSLAVLVRQLSIRVLLLVLPLAVLLSGVSPWAAQFLHLPSPKLVVLLVPIGGLSLLLGVTSGALQGTLAFFHLSVVSLVGASVRLVLSVVLVKRGGGVAAVMVATGVAFVLSYVYSALSLRRLVRSMAPTGEGSSDSGRPPVSLTTLIGPAFVVLLGLTSLFSLDLLLAKRLLTPEEAGLYSGLSLLGRIIYFVCLPITLAMYPHVAQRTARGQPSRRILFLTGGAVVFCAATVIAVYAIVPRWVIHYSLGDVYRSAAGALWIFGLFLGCVAVATWLLYAFLALGRSRVAVLPFVAVVLQLVLIARFHASLHAVAISSLIAAAFLCASLGLVAVRVFSASARPAVAPAV